VIDKQLAQYWHLLAAGADQAPRFADDLNRVVAERTKLACSLRHHPASGDMSETKALVGVSSPKASMCLLESLGDGVAAGVCEVLPVFVRPNAKRNGRYDNSDFQHDQDTFWSAQLELYPQYILFHYSLHRNKPHHILHLAALATAGFDGGRGTYSKQRSW
jgi:hypothetical protein